MPTGYKFSARQGRWTKIQREQSFDYTATNLAGGALLISYFRVFPDKFLDKIESPNADFTLAYPQRVIMRSFAQNRETFVTSCRGLGKTYIEMCSNMVDGVLCPGEIMRMYAPAQKQAAELASKAFHQIERNYPALAALWKIKSETKDTFKIVTDYGSELSIGQIQGGNCHSITAEEIGQEVEPRFNFQDFESKAIPTCRLERSVNKQIDITHISQHYKYITNACRRINPAFYKYRNDRLKAMATMPYGNGIVMDISWEMAVLFDIRSIPYIEQLKNSMTKEDFLRQMAAIYTGASENPMVSDEDLSASRTLRVMESRHCGNPDVIYIVGHDVSYEEGTRNAKCADVVMKLTPYGDMKSQTKRDKYLKEIVWVDTYPPPKDHSLAARHIKDLWLRFTLDGGNTTWIAIDAWQYGNAVMKELIKPSADGINLCCYQHLEAAELEQPNALEVIYPIKAGGAGTRDNDFDMIQYMRVEYEQGNIKMLTSDVLDGLDAYKKYHNIKDDGADIKILQPYYRTNEACEQIQNLQVAPSGKGFKEKRISMSIQRDIWSAEKYCGRVAYILESILAQEHARTKKSWDEKFAQIDFNVNYGNQRSNLLRLRRR